jgi:hypothetical protein
MGLTLGLTDPIVDLKLDCMKMCRECVYKKLLKTLYSRYIYGSTRLNISYFNLMIAPPQTLGEYQATKLDQPIQTEHKHDEHTTDRSQKCTQTVAIPRIIFSSININIS